MIDTRYLYAGNPDRSESAHRADKLSLLCERFERCLDLFSGLPIPDHERHLELQGRAAGQAMRAMLQRHNEALAGSTKTG